MGDRSEREDLGRILLELTPCGRLRAQDSVTRVRRLRLVGILPGVVLFSRAARVDERVRAFRHEP